MKYKPYWFLFNRFQNGLNDLNRSKSYLIQTLLSRILDQINAEIFKLLFGYNLDQDCSGIYKSISRRHVYKMMLDFSNEAWSAPGAGWELRVAMANLKTSALFAFCLSIL